jgi:argininosuccinate lyase
MRERLSAAYGQEVVDYLVRPRLAANLEANFAALMTINRAHVVMLAEEAIVDRAAAAALIACFLQMEGEGPTCVRLDPAKEDLYFNLEAEVIGRTEEAVGGQMHTGRSRNDLYATMQRMVVRRRVLDLSRMVNALRGRLLELAERHCETVMTGYTHLQPAQPITFGHYLSGIADALARDARRLLAVWGTVNLSPLGAAALATTGFPIRRERTAELLGFDALLENSIDAVASRDYVPEILAALTGAAVTIGRLGHDLQVWYTHEFGFVDVTDDLAGTSSIMPQKKNPMPIEHLKAKSAQLMGALVASLASLKGTGFMHSREVFDESVYPLGEAAQQAEAVLCVADAVLRGLRVNESRMLEAARRNFSTLTDLADALVREHGFSFRAAHQVVGALTREAVQSGLKSSMDIDRALIEAVIARITGRNVCIEAAKLDEYLDPRRNVERRSVAGGPARTTVLRMLERARRELSADEALVVRREAQLEAAGERLREAGAKVMGAARGAASS